MIKEHILCVDDEAVVLQSLRQELRHDGFFGGMAVEVADSGPSALELIDDILEEGDEIPVIISDQRMPLMSGDAFILAAHERIPDTLNILLTGYSDIGAVAKLVNGNALYRYLSKPWDGHDLLLTIREACRAWRQKRTIVEMGLKIEHLTTAMVAALESAHHYFDEETGSHILRMARISEFIARKAGLDERFVRLVSLYAPLHDIGKVGVDREILLKPGKLTPGEFDRVKEHVEIGHRILQSDAIDAIARNIVLYHHERWAGNGYVNGLAGTDIPLEARIVAIADVFDALVSERVYKPAYPLEQALEFIRTEKNASFDPRLVEAFLDGIAAVPDPRTFFQSPST